MIRNFSVLAMVTILIFSCQNENKIIISENNGIITVQNPDTPIQKNIEPLKFEEIFRVGLDLENEHEIFHGIINLHVDKNRSLFVAEQGNNRVQQFDKNGNFLQIFGGGGQGPGEYMFPSSILTSSKGEIIILDGQIGKLIYFDQKGNYLKDDRIRDEIQKSIASPHFIDEQSIMFFYRKFNHDIKELIEIIEVYSFNLVKRELKELMSLKVAREIIAGETGGAIFRKKWEPKVVISPQFEIFASNSLDFKIEIYNKHGKKLKNINCRYKKVPLSQMEKQSFRSPIIEGKKFSPPKYHADIQAIFFIIPNECWVLTSSQIDNKRVIDVFDQEGKFKKQLSINIPVNLKRSYNNLLVKLLFDETAQTLFLYQVEHNENDIEQIVCYQAQF